MKDYRIVTCAGDNRVPGAIMKMQEDDPEWEVHSITVTNVEEYQTASPLDITSQQGVIAVTKYLILFERENTDERVTSGRPRLST